MSPEVKTFLDHLRDETFFLRRLAVSLKSAETMAKGAGK
jgi:hypothetical protein